jgi:hypothetical protein
VGAAELALELSYRESGRSLDDFALFRKDDDKGVTEEGLENKIVVRGIFGKFSAYLGKLVLRFGASL